MGNGNEKRILRRSACVVALAAAAIIACSARATAAEEAFEVHDISLWILDPGVPMANARSEYPSALPATIRSARGAGTATAAQQQVQVVAPAPGQAPRLVVARNNAATGIGTAYRRDVAPINVITFHGPPARDLDVELRTKSGNFLAHWPPGEGFPNRLRWAGNPGFDLVDEADESEMMFVDDKHWFAAARRDDGLYVRRGTRSERFLAYDAELNLEAPFSLEGGPDEFTVVNRLDVPLYDVLISRYTDQGRRIAWLDVLPPSNQARPAAKPAAAAEAKPADVFVAPKQEPPVPVPAGEEKPPADAPAPEAKAAAEAKPAAKLPATAPKLFGGLPGQAKSVPAKKPPAEAPAAAKPAAQLFGGLPKDAQKRLEAARASRPAKPATGKPAASGGLFGGLPAQKAVQGTPVTLSEPIPADGPDAAARMSEELNRRLRQAGLTEGEANLFVDRYGPAFFEGEALVVACRLGEAVIEDKVPLSVFPKPAKTVRVAMVLVRDADPQLGEKVEELIAQLGAPQYSEREAAQQRLLELGPLAFPALNRALNNADPEIVIRAERILLTQNQAPNPQAAPGPGRVIRAAPAVIIRN